MHANIAAQPVHFCCKRVPGRLRPRLLGALLLLSGSAVAASEPAAGGDAPTAAASAATAIPDPNASTAGSPASSESLGGGRAIFGAHLMRHTRSDEDSASARFTPPLPLDHALIAGAMRSLTRQAFGDHQLGTEGMADLEPVLGEVIEVTDLEYRYRFWLDGAEATGVGTILVTRELLPPTDAEAELLELLRELEGL